MLLFVFGLLLVGGFRESATKITDQEYYSLPNLFQFDDFDKCLHHSNEAVYCMVTVQLLPENKKNSSGTWDAIQEISSDKNNYRHDLLRHGICASEICSQSNETISSCLGTTYGDKYRNFGLVAKVNEMRCETKESKFAIQTEDIILIVVLGFYIVFVGFLSILLEFLRYRSKTSLDLQNNNSEKTPGVYTFLSVFSIFDNVRLILNKKIAKSADDYMFFIQGIRFATAIGVIFTHAAEINVITPVANPSYTEEVPKRFITMLLANGGMTVQIYLIISSFLLAVSFFKKLKNTDSVGLGYVVRYIIRRYIRFTPAYALIIALHSTWLIHLARSPFWEPIIGEDYKVCRLNWWKNLLYFNNFVIDDGLCMFHSWYLSVDFQFVILGILILWLTQKKPKTLFIVAALVIAFQTVFLFFVLLWNDFEIAVVLTPELLYFFKLIYSKEWQATWTTTYSNLSGLVIGLCFGYLYTHKNGEIITKKIHTILWWILSWTLSLAPLLISSYYMTTEYYHNTRWFAAAYGSVAKTIFAIGMGILIFGMSQGLGGLMKKSFEWGPMYTLGQLSFGAYLVHFTLLKINAAARKYPPFVSDFQMFTDIITNVSMSYICSGVLTVLLLMPVAGISNKII